MSVLILTSSVFDSRYARAGAYFGPVSGPELSSDAAVWSCFLGTLAGGTLVWSISLWTFLTLHYRRVAEGRTKFFPSRAWLFFMLAAMLLSISYPVLQSLQNQNPLEQMAYPSAVSNAWVSALAFIILTSPLLLTGILYRGFTSEERPEPPPRPVYLWEDVLVYSAVPIVWLVVSGFSEGNKYEHLGFAVGGCVVWIAGIHFFWKHHARRVLEGETRPFLSPAWLLFLVIMLPMFVTHHVAKEDVRSSLFNLLLGRLPDGVDVFSIYFVYSFVAFCPFLFTGLLYRRLTRKKPVVPVNQSREGASLADPNASNRLLVSKFLDLSPAEDLGYVLGGKRLTGKGVTAPDDIITETIPGGRETQDITLDAVTAHLSRELTAGVTLERFLTHEGTVNGWLLKRTLEHGYVVRVECIARVEGRSMFLEARRLIVCPDVASVRVATMLFVLSALVGLIMGAIEGEWTWVWIGLIGGVAVSMFVAKLGQTSKDDTDYSREVTPGVDSVSKALLSHVAIALRLAASGQDLDDMRTEIKPIPQTPVTPHDGQWDA